MRKRASAVSILADDCRFFFIAALLWVSYCTFSVVLSSKTIPLPFTKSTKVGDTKRSVSFLEHDLARQNAANANDNITLIAIPDQPDRMVLLLLSIVASNSEVSQSLSDGIITCLSNVSNTDVGNWGAFKLDRFTPVLVQLEYFVLTSEEGSLDVPEIIDKFIREGMLTECVQLLDVGLPANGRLLQGRTVIATETGQIVSAKGNIPGWVIGAIIGCVVGAGLIALIFIWCQGETIYTEEDYEKYEDDESNEDGDTSESDDEELRNANVTDRIAGQRREGIVFHT